MNYASPVKELPSAAIGNRFEWRCQLNQPMLCTFTGGGEMVANGSVILAPFINTMNALGFNHACQLTF